MELRKLKMIVPPEIRRTIGISLNEARKNVYKLPIVGRKLWESRMTELGQSPQQLNIEITSICNAKCIMCPRHLMERKMEPMPFGLYEKIIQEAASIGVKIFALNGYGEIFTMKKDYHKYIDYLLERIPNARIVINSNGSLLNESVAQYLIDKKVDTLHVDIDGATKETFEKIRQNLRYKTVVANIKRLIEMRNQQGAKFPKIRIGMIEQPENRHEKEIFIKQWRGLADYVHGELAVSRLGWFNVSRDKMVDNPCALPFFEMTILANGEVVLCCDDWNGEESLGSIHHSTITEVWQSQLLKKYREFHLSGKADQISVCSQCDFARPGPTWFSAHNNICTKDELESHLKNDENQKNNSVVAS